MKTKLFILALFFAVVGCGSDDKDSPSPSNNIFMKANVGGQTLDVKGSGSPSDTRGTGVVYEKGDQKLFINGNNGTILISITLEDYNKSTGSFTLGGIDTGKTGTYIDNTNASNPVYYSSTTGTVTITKITSDRVEGTFSFTGYNDTLKKDVVVSAGEFAAPFQEI